MGTLLPKNTVQINEQEYTLAIDRHGARQFQMSAVPASGQRKINTVEWRVDGPDLFSHARLGEYLGRHYGVNTDGRWKGIDCLGPLVNFIDVDDYDNVHAPSLLGTSNTVLGTDFFLGGYAAAPTESIGMALFQALGIWYAYVIRGQFPAKIKISNLTAMPPGIILPAVATDIIATTNDVIAIRRELSIAMGNTAYKTLKEPDVADSGDTWQDNADLEPATKFGAAPDRTVLLHEKTAKGNIQEAAVTMTTPDWQDVATLKNEDITFTAFALDGNLWLLGTSRGPFFLNADTGVFEAIMPELDYSEENSKGMIRWFPIGTVIPMADGLRYSKGLSGESFGPEKFLGNSSPVQGTSGGGSGSTRWFLTPLYNAQTDETYLVMWRPRQADDVHPYPMSPYTIARFSSVRSKWTRYIGTVNGVRTNPLWMGGYGAGVYYLTGGRTSREIDDANYTFAASGTTYLTELQLEEIGDIECFEFMADDAAAGKTIQLAVSIDRAAAVTVGSAVTSEGFQRVYASSGGIPQSTVHGGHFIRPEIRYATNSSAITPRVLGWLRMRWRSRPPLIKTWQMSLIIPDEESGRTSEDLEEELMARWGGAPVKLEDTDDKGTEAHYCTVDSVKVHEVEAGAGSGDTSHGVTRVADVLMSDWPVS